ncbi:tagatose 1,6-diphosphate aldolase [bacterium]|nr:tagatose 1,6-diphosphate aldolase [bacterium]
MAQMTLSKGKLARMDRLSGKRGVIAAAAMDQRGSLLKAIAKERGCDPKEITDQMMQEFKTAVSKVLTPHATAILLDPEWGLPAAKARAKNSGLLLSYEKSGYDNTRPGRLPDLLDGVSARDIVNMGGDAVKILIYYSPDDERPVKDIKHAFIRRIGAECEYCEIPFFLEFVTYDPKGGDEKGLDYAKRKPDLVVKSMEEYSKPEYNVDVLKVEVPINMKFVGGAKSNKTGQVAYDRAQAKEIFQKSYKAAKRPFIYLSAGVSDDEFRETLELAQEAGVPFNGVLCGRATWKDGIPVYAKKGLKAFEDWLADRGVKNIEALNVILGKAAHPWHERYGGRDKIAAA